MSNKKFALLNIRSNDFNIRYVANFIISNDEYEFYLVEYPFM